MTFDELFLDYYGTRSLPVMTLDPSLLAILCCPETRQAVHLADATLIQKVNAALSNGHVRNRGSRLLVGQIEGGLLREDQRVLYPIRDRIPVMLIEEGIPMEQILPAE